MVDGSVTSYLKGNLVITISDATTEKPVWVGWMTEKIEDPERRDKSLKSFEKKVRRVVKRIMSRYPPKK